MLLKNTPLVLATHNAGKIAELTQALAPYFSDIKSAADFGLAAPAEDGQTYVENALIKARAAAAGAGCVALADDSGVEVEGIHDALGVNTKEFELAHDTVDAAYRALYQRTGPGKKMLATCVFAIVSPSGQEHIVTGVAHGEFVYPARGSNGFGFDPYFLMADGRTFGQLELEQKEIGSHRGAALRQLIALLQ